MLSSIGIQVQTVLFSNDFCGEVYYARPQSEIKAEMTACNYFESKSCSHYLAVQIPRMLHSRDRCNPSG